MGLDILLPHPDLVARAGGLGEREQWAGLDEGLLVVMPPPFSFAWGVPMYAAHASDECQRVLVGAQAAEQLLEAVSKRTVCGGLGRILALHGRSSTSSQIR